MQKVVETRGVRAVAMLCPNVTRQMLNCPELRISRRRSKNKSRQLSQRPRLAHAEVQQPLERFRKGVDLSLHPIYHHEAEHKLDVELQIVHCHRNVGPIRHQLKSRIAGEAKIQASGLKILCAQFAQRCQRFMEHGVDVGQVHLSDCVTQHTSPEKRVQMQIYQPPVKHALRHGLSEQTEHGQHMCRRFLVRVGKQQVLYSDFTKHSWS
mmetsp:Transcript_38701/g.92933  ORF Transcript_38701/g.92933 Transcript_38701/m.92933 type:complete len:209 (-) Transcript_38701:1503-2129(-)